MRRLSMCAVLVFSVVTAACRPAPGTRTLAKGEVSVNVQCVSGGGVSFTLKPWAVDMSDNDDFTWFNESTNVDIDITTTTHYPFNGQPHHVGHNGKAVGKPISKTPKGTYKYSVVTSCLTSDGRKVVIDPDMIIPRETQ